MEMSGKLKALGESLVEMNSDARLASAGVSEEAAKSTILYDAKNGNQFKIDGADKLHPKISLRILDSWHEVPDRTGSAFDVLMAMIREDGRW